MATESLNLKNQFEFAEENEIKLVGTEACEYEFDDTVKVTVRCLRILMDLPNEKVVRMDIDSGSEDYLTVMQLKELSKEQHFTVLVDSDDEMAYYIVDYQSPKSY